MLKLFFSDLLVYCKRAQKPNDCLPGSIRVKAKKITILFFIIIAVSSSLKSAAQTITFSGKKVKLQEAFDAIKKQTNYTVVYNPEHLAKATPITVNAKDMPLETFLKTIIEKQSLEYSIVNTTIVIYHVAEFTIATTEPTTVSGTVQNSFNQPLDGASIVVQRTKEGTIANAKGEFALKNIKGGDTLIISLIGYNTQKMPINDQANISILLQDATNQLDEVVRTAYGRTSQRFATGDITKVTAAEIEKQPVMNPLLALQGRVPGLVITPINGFASSPISVQLRGLNSLNVNVPSDPLYIIDGVPLTVLSLVNQNSYARTSTGFIQSISQYGIPTTSVTGGQSPLFSINPGDIESIEVLKDAAATAVYGSNAANGVILITTKKGKPGATKFEFNIDPPFLSFGKTTSHINLMNTQQYLQMRREAFKNDGITPNLQNAPDLLLWDTTRYIDWQKATDGAMARNLNVSAGVSGGNELTTFRINANYTRLTNTTNISGATQRVTVGANINNSTRDHKFSLSLSTNFSYSYVNVIAPVTNVFLAPDAPPFLDKNGNPNWAAWNANGLLSIYPFGSYLSPANPQSTTTLTNSLLLHFNPFKGFVISTVFGYNFAYNATNAFSSIASQDPYLNNITGSATYSTTHNSGWAINPQMTYNRRLGKGDLQLMLVATEQVTTTNAASQSGFGYTSDILLGSINNALISYAAGTSGQAKTASFVGDVNYIYDKKYILDLNGTRQGSSKFGPDNKYGNFGSVSVAWIASEEELLKKVLPDFVSFLKFRGSYGLTGSDGVADYQYLALWNLVSPGAGYGSGYNGQQALIPSVRDNQKYRWENVTKLEIAMNLGLLKDKITLSADYYKNLTTNQLTTAPTPNFLNSSLISGLVTNLPLTIQNSGWEGTVTAKLVTHKNFNLFASFNISHNKNILLSFPNLANTPYAGQYAIGRSLNTVYLYHFLGIDPLTGQPAFKDYNNNGKLDYTATIVPQPENDDRWVAYDLQPKFTGGFGIGGNYKKVSFSAFFTYKKQIGKNGYGLLPGLPGAFNVNQPEEVFNQSWHKPGDIATYPAFTTAPSYSPQYQFMQISDGVYSDASYIRLSNLSISYALPDTWVRKIGMKNLSVSLNAQNLFLISSYKGGDPETQTLFAPPKLYTFRIMYNF